VVVHIRNSQRDTLGPGGVNSVVNDLFAPVQTIVGAYGKQTDVNNKRLEHYLALHAMDWFEINLFSERCVPEYYPMSWVMSKAVRDSMAVRLRTEPRLNALIALLNAGDGGISPQRRQER
jgi:hypothetical protein